MGSREPACPILRRRRQEEEAQGQVQRVAAPRELWGHWHVKFAVSNFFSLPFLPHLRRLDVCADAVRILMGVLGCRSRILTLDGARYSITERKGGIGCVGDILFPVWPAPIIPLTRSLF